MDAALSLPARTLGTTAMNPTSTAAAPPAKKSAYLARNASTATTANNRQWTILLQPCAWMAFVDWVASLVSTTATRPQPTAARRISVPTPPTAALVRRTAIWTMWWTTNAKEATAPSISRPAAASAASSTSTDTLMTVARSTPRATRSTAADETLCAPATMAHLIATEEFAPSSAKMALTTATTIQRPTAVKSKQTEMCRIAGPVTTFALLTQ